MKTAIYLEDDRLQVVLTPENKFEKSILEAIGDHESVKILRGSFYACQGGWTRHRTEDESIMLVLDKKAADQPAPLQAVE